MDMVCKEEQQQDQVENAHCHQIADARLTPTQPNPYISSSNHLGAGARQGGKFVNSSLNNPVFNIHGETIYDRLNSFQTELRERALKPKRQGNLWLTMAMLIGILAWVVVIGVIIAGIYYYYYYCDTHRCDIKNIKTYLQ